MSWGKIDDQFHAHRKAKLAWRASRASLGLHFLALSYCAGQLTDGFVDPEFVEEKLPISRERTQATDALVQAGLWIAEDAGWRINDYLDYNPSRDEVAAKRRADAERKARKRDPSSARIPAGVRADSERNPAGVPAASRAGADAPIPAVPNPTPTPPQPPASGGRARDRAAYEKRLAAWVAEHFPGVPSGLVAQGADQLRRQGDEPTPEALRPWVERWDPA